MSRYIPSNHNSFTYLSLAAAIGMHINYDTCRWLAMQELQALTHTWLLGKYNSRAAWSSNVQSTILCMKLFAMSSLTISSFILEFTRLSTFLLCCSTTCFCFLFFFKPAHAITLAINGTDLSKHQVESLFFFARSIFVRCSYITLIVSCTIINFGDAP